MFELFAGPIVLTEKESAILTLFFGAMLIIPAYLMSFIIGYLIRKN